MTKVDTNGPEGKLRRKRHRSEGRLSIAKCVETKSSSQCNGLYEPNIIWIRLPFVTKLFQFRLHYKVNSMVRHRRSRPGLKYCKLDPPSGHSV